MNAKIWIGDGIGTKELTGKDPMVVNSISVILDRLMILMVGLKLA